jgi:hypothetical protein
MTTSIGKTFGHRWAVAAAILLGSMATAEVSKAETPIPVANFTTFTDKALSDYLTGNLKTEIKNEIVRRKLAVFALTEKFDGKQACFAMVGLTEAAPKGRNPRLPANTKSRFAVQDDKLWSEGKCVAEQVENAIRELNAASLAESLEKIDFTTSLGGIRNDQKSSSDLVSLFTDGVAKENKQPLFDIVPHKFASAFDYRYVQSSMLVRAIQFDGGVYMCVAFAGVTGKNPDGRTFRWPGYTTANVRVQTGGTIDACRQIVAEEALTRLLDEPWTEKGLLDNFAASREDGIPLPRAQKEKPPQKQPTTTTSTTRQTNRTSCTNDCMNGSCVRKFPDGTTERWQAPRKLDPFSQNWGWDTTTNACGL